ncbi:hypothetical protein BCO18430_04802 [Burkholderia contaminans]|nr:hypothetical protein BCO18430_04802 [Burkholderia contaminans]
MPPIQIPSWITGQQRTAIDTMSLHRQPMRSNVTLFKDMHTQPPTSCDGVHRAMNFPTIAKHDHIREVPDLHYPLVPGMQIIDFSAVIPCWDLTGIE